MKTVLIASDSYKGAATAAEVCHAIATGIHRADPSIVVRQLPLADGGEGTVETVLAARGGRRVTATVTGVFPGDTVRASYALLTETTAVIEMAATAGLPLAAGHLDPGATTTRGVGELIRHAIESGATELLIGAGGSATHDLGLGAAWALGARFYTAEGEDFIPTGSRLRELDRVDVSAVADTLGSARLQVLCDIDNPLTGPQGATAIFAPQKGATDRQLIDLEAGMVHAEAVIARDTGVSVAQLPGAAAAGGLAAGLASVAGASVVSGIATLLDLLAFEDQLTDCDVVLTGEGRLDGQSLSGKVPVGVARATRTVAARTGRAIPVIALAGALGDELEDLYAEGLTAVFPIGSGPQSLQAAIRQTTDDLTRESENLFRLLRRVGTIGVPQASQ
ncbi:MULTISPECIES: glycerate kinase [Auritidibacter]|uniref:glycerate kinase n=1 Tax=Auritidibacter TaxID=1160973 RepID=UPI000D7270AF|nr:MULTISPECIES: glycerate kinase [Auritidibacter]AXR74857.1 glycerate kinase [Auritidibacter sp. NML130574]NIH71273.1 glycerate kinase [Auritidibacter ignavus]PXA78301.1 glycerate kinase [Auritidibacter sp. NML100628]PXA81067.1 glycerate kinase [Auritidibacter sp. NML120636]RMX23545.1 glycerate kinase [Auritidibacter ignavus]